MPLAAGDKIGHYEILAPIGKGGMGEVFRARDTRLNREVAIKTSSTHFSERFEREARAIAALNHPNICTLHDVGSNYLVMEFVEGEPLKGPLPLGTALHYARQISSALEAAHDKQITHRDLKPGNILVTANGVVKVLDFGLAKIGDPPRADSDPDNSPTVTIGATVAGTILGTAAYMAPEQARGKQVDKRADIWAFGVVLYELLTGERLFKGEDITETLAAVVMKEPDFNKVPFEVRRLLKKCLQKDPKNRLRDIGDVWELLETKGPAGKRPQTLAWAIAGVATLALLTTLGWAYISTPPSEPGPVVRFNIPPAPGTKLTARNSASAHQAISPDGRYIVFVADDTEEGGKTQVLWVRAIDSLGARRLDNATDAFEPFWSPDSKHIAYFSGGKLMRIPLTGGSSVNICDVCDYPDTANSSRGAVWYGDRNSRSDGVIFFMDATRRIQRVPASGGSPTPVTKLGEGEAAHAYPQVLPDGSKLLFYVVGGKQPGIWVQDLSSGERTFLFPAERRAVVTDPDLLLFTRDRTLFAQRWDWSALKPASEPVVIADGLAIGNVSNARSSFSASQTGAVVFRGGIGSNGFLHRWYSMDGKPGASVGRSGQIGAVAISPDGRWAAAVRTGDLEVLDTSTGTLAILATDVTGPYLTWSPDSRRVLFAKADGTYQALIGTGKTTLLYPGGVEFTITDWTKDGLLGHRGKQIMLFPIPGEVASGTLSVTPQTLGEIQGNFSVEGSQFRVSPDGKWLAYSSASRTLTDGTNFEVWVASFPSLTNRRVVAGGREPTWRADGKQLLFSRNIARNNSAIYAVDVKAGPVLEFGPPKLLFRAPGLAVGTSTAPGFAITPDGKRVLARSIAGDPSLSANAVEELFVVLNWPSLVK